MEDSAAADQAFRESIHILETLVYRSPDHPAWVFELADTLMHGATIEDQNDANDAIEAEECLSGAIAYSERLLKRFPNVTEYQLLHGSAFARRASIQDALGALSDAEDSHRDGVTTLEPLVAQFPDNGVFQIALAQARRNLSNHLRLKDALSDTPGDSPVESLYIIEKTIADYDEYMEGAQWSPFTGQIQASLYQSLAESLAALGRYDEAHQAWQQADLMGLMLP